MWQDLAIAGVGVVAVILALWAMSGHTTTGSYVPVDCDEAGNWIVDGKKFTDLSAAREYADWLEGGGAEKGS